MPAMQPDATDANNLGFPQEDGPAAPVHVAGLGNPAPLLEAIGGWGARAVELVAEAGDREAISQVRSSLQEGDVTVTFTGAEVTGWVGWVEALQGMADRHGISPRNFVVHLSTVPDPEAPMALCAAYLVGMWPVQVTGAWFDLLPALRFRFEDEVSDAKNEVLQALQASGGRVESLKELATRLEVESSNLSYHLRGNGSADGLETLGLVEVERGPNRALEIRLTTLETLVARQLVPGP